MHEPFRLASLGKRLGLVRAVDDAPSRDIAMADTVTGDGAAKPLSPRLAMRADLLTGIADFITTHDLRLTAANFELARDVVSGNDFRLATAVHSWIAEHGRLSDDDVTAILTSLRPGVLDMAALLDMLRAIEANSVQFDALTHQSRGSAEEFSSALEVQASALSSGNVAKVVADLVGLTHAMIRRSRDIEEQMLDSQKQTRKLRRNLTAARHAADHDHLTGLPNRRAFDQLLSEEIENARPRDEPLIIAFCDIDNFKDVNDRHGHATGDRVLKFVADLLSGISNRKCHIARHGGEEFALLFRNTGIDAAFAIVDQAREDLSERSLVLKDRNERLDRITFSAGLADIFAHADTRSALEAADQALYRAKNGGRNRVCRG